MSVNISYLAMTTVNLPGSQLTYYASITELTPKQAIAKTQESTQADQSQYPQVSAPIIFAPILIFFVLFLGALILQIINKSLNIRRGIMVVIIAFFAASIPVVLPHIRGGVGQQTKATPSITPRNVIVARISRDSALVTWNTSQKQIGAVKYGISSINNKTFI